MGMELAEADRIAGPAVVLFVIFIIVERRVRDPLTTIPVPQSAFVLITVGGTMANTCTQ